MGEETALDTSRVGRRIIERPRLTRLLTESESRVMLLVAPAGYGKTTLARQWLQDRPHAWYQATPAALDVAALALGLAASASEVVNGIGSQLRARLKTVGDAASAAGSLASDLALDFSEWPSDVRLVIDDYHLVTESEAAEAFLAQLVRETTIPLLITSRTRPSWVTAKSLLYGDTLELGRNVLAMTHGEAAEALASTHDEVPGLVALADGWPAVIGLAALVPNLFRDDTSEVPETLHEYLADELYEAVGEEARWNAAQLAIAPDIDEHVAKALFAEHGGRVLDQSHRSGFLTKVAGGFEMHPLVRQFLHLKLGEFEPASVQTSARTVGTAYADSGRWDEAALVAMDFQLMDVLLRVLTEALDAQLSEGRLTTLRRWLEFARTREPTAPIVRLASVEIDFRAGDWTAANGKALQLARSIQTESPLASRVYLRAGQMAHLDDRQHEALELLTAAKQQARSPHDLRRALWSRFLALCDLEERDEAERALREVEALPPLTSEDLLRAGQGRLHFAGRWGPLVETLDNVSGLVELVEQSTDPLVRTGFLQTYGSTLGLVARYDEASAVADRQLEQAERYRLDWVLPHALEMRAVAQTGKRDFEGALRSIRRARRMANEQGNAHAEVNGAVLTARVYLCRGAAERAAELLDRRESRFTSPGMEGEYLATHALSLACCSRTAGALKLISDSELVSHQLDAIALREFARLIALYFNSDNGKREDLKRKALVTAQETGNFGAFVCAYRAFPTLLQGLADLTAVDLRPFTTLVSTLDPGLAERSGLRAKTRGRTTSREPLTRREREIMDLLRQGLSNREIARTLWITESTVKVHVRHVLAKMGVRSRSEAIAASNDSD